MLSGLKLFFSGKKLWVIAIVGVVILGIWGAMKYDNSIIRGLQKDLTDTKVERDSAVLDSKINEEVRTIDDTTLKDQLEEQETIDKETDQATRDMNNEIASILSDIDEQIEPDGPVDTEINTPDEVTDNVGDKPDVKKKQPEEKLSRDTPSVDPRVASSVINGMWKYYCNSVEDPSNCTQ